MLLRRFASGIVTAAASLLAVYAIVLVLDTDSSNDANILWRWAFLLAGWFPVVFLHELGHAFAAEAAGWRVVAFHVAPWAVRLRPFHFSFAGYLGGQDVAGFVAAAPRTRETNTNWRETVFTAGGPIVSWLCAILLLGLAMLAPSSAETGPGALLNANGTDMVISRRTDDGLSYDFLRSLCIGFGLFSLSSALVSTWPRFEGERGVNDAGMIAALWSERRPTSFTYAYSLITYGVPRRKWESWIANDMTQAKGEASANALAVQFILFLACMMERDDAGARETSGAMHAISPDGAATRIALAAVAAIVDHDHRSADDHLAKVKNLENAWPPVLRLRQIAIAAATAHEDGPAAINRIDDAARGPGEQLDYPDGVWSKLNTRVVALARRRGVLG